MADIYSALSTLYKTEPYKSQIELSNKVRFYSSSDIHYFFKGVGKSISFYPSFYGASGSKFYLLRENIYGFKKLENNKIASLIIPRNEIVHVPVREHETITKYNFHTFRSTKLRASGVIVGKIFNIINRKEEKTGYSMDDPDFLYKVSEYIRPTGTFSFEPYVCESGIHFFLDLEAALNYAI